MMRHLGYSLVLTLLAVWWGGCLALAGTTYTDSLIGSLAPPGSSSLSLEADASGALPGHLVVSININDDGVVTDGAWWLTVKQKLSDGSSPEVGTLTGTFARGTVSRDADRNVLSLNSLALSIQNGSGRYVHVTSGTGTLEGTFNRQNSQSFTGRLNLEF